MSVNDQILDAIELLAKNSVERAGYDKTIQAQIMSCQDKQLGKYKCKYQDALFYAYASNPNVSLSNGTMVYILVPQNDMSKDKTIIGTIDKLGTDFVTIAEGEDAYEKVGVNSITAGGPFYLNTNNSNYSYNSILSRITLDSTGLKSYINKSSFLVIAATIRTQSPLNKLPNGSNSEYGITFTLSFSDGTTKDYTLNEDNMTGDPFNLISPTRQAVVLPIDGQNFTGISKIAIYNRGFSGATGTQTGLLSSGDIVISNLEIYGANRLSQQQLNGVMISLYTPDGAFFTTSESATKKKRIMAQIKVKGQVVPSEGVSFYWGLEDMNVVSSHADFNQYLGYGWKHMTTCGQTGWDPESDYLILQKSNVRCSKNTYKVAAIYDGNLVTRQIDIQNLSTSIPTITIISNSGNQFYNNVGTPTLICTTTGATAAAHRWGWANNGGYFEQAADVIGTVNGNQLQQVQVFKIINYADFKCTVYDSSGYLGTGTITLTNEESDKANYLTIVNGQTMFKYSEGGAAPNSDSLQNPQLIQPLTFELRDPSGTVISPSTIATSPNGYIKWSIPNNNTMLVDENNSGGSSQGNYTVYENVTTLSYNIAHTFDYKKTNNQILLEVHYGQIISYAQTRFVFTKQGDVGTNGTEYTVRIALNTNMSSPPQYPMITNANGTIKINYGVGSTSSETTFSGAVKLFKAELWRSGERIWYDGGSTVDGTTAPTVEWSILKNKYSSSEEDSSDFTVSNASTGTFTYTDSTKNSVTTAKANIIKCTLTYMDKMYFGTIPVTTAYVSNSSYRISLVENTGFRYAIYTADGTSPQYDSTNPFDIMVKSGSSRVSSGTYTFGTCGSIKGTSVSPQQLTAITVDGLQSYQKKYKPIDKYDGECVNNAVTCSYSGSITAKIRIPVHLLLNRFGQSNINAWDGNSVQIDSNGGFILAPQMGAGVKDSNNRFTGVVMGKVREAGSANTQIGLFGYSSGARSFFLDSNTGSATFGRTGTGQIVINATSATITGGNYSTSGSGSGMQINLGASPSIKYGNKNFEVDSSGNIKAGYDSSNSDWNFKVNNGSVTLVGDLKAGKISGTSNYNFEISNSATGNNPLIRAGYNSGSYNFVVQADGDVSLKGAITATSGYIGEGTRKWTIGGNSSNGWIYYNRSAFNTSSGTSGIYIGTDGISVGNGTKRTFSVSRNGAVYIEGEIVLGSGSSISWNQVTNKPSFSAVATSGDYDDLIDKPNIPVVPSYIQSTYIDGTRVQSIDIYGGKFYATGTGDSDPAYYISAGGTTTNGVFRPNSPIGFIAYDANGAGSTEQARNRVIFKTISDGTYRYPLKIISASNLSLEGTPIRTYSSVAGGYISVGGAVFISGNYTRFTGAIKVPIANYLNNNRDFEGVYGSTLPNTGYLSNPDDVGRIFFLLDS